MIDRLFGFVAALRDAGVAVSPSEVIDACSAVSVITLEDREVLRGALAATVLKDIGARPIFDRLFEVFFSLGAHRDATVTPEEYHEALSAALEAGDTEQMRRLAGEAVENFAGMTPGRQVSGVYYAYRTARGLDLDRLHSELLTGLSLQDPEDQGLSGEAERETRRRIAALKRAIDEEVAARLVEDRSANDLARTLALTLPEDTDIMHASREELRALRGAVGPLAVKLASRMERRHRSHQIAALDVRATIRRSLSTGGVPVVPVTRRRRIDRPEIVLLTDISGSVASFARFTIQLMYALAHELRRLRAFAFIDAVDEVTEHFGGGVDIDSALRGIGSSARVVGMAGHSDYGATFRSFADRYGESLSRRTTFIVCGDSRTNYHDPASATFRSLAESARATYWLNPEPATYWDTGDSVMAAYGRYCDAVVECRTLRQLENFISDVL
ncbi:MAG: vWA domain-containing protein [Ferrimicrobium sp.]